MDNKSLESFINLCDEMQIANESKIDINNIKQKLIKLIDGFLRIIDILRKKIISFVRNIKLNNEKYCYGPTGTLKYYNDIEWCYLKGYHLQDEMRDYLDKLKKLDWDDSSVNKVEKINKSTMIQSIHTVQERIDKLKSELNTLRNNFSNNNSRLKTIERELKDAKKKYDEIYDQEYNTSYNYYDNLEEPYRHNRSVFSASFMANNTSGLTKLDDEKYAIKDKIDELKYKIKNIEDELNICTIYLDTLNFIINKQ